MEIKFIISVNYSFNVMQVTAMSTWQVLLIYIYVVMSKYWSLTVLYDFVCMCLRVCVCVCVCARVCVCVCVSVCVMSNQSTSKETHYVSDLSKLNALLHETNSKILLVLR